MSMSVAPSARPHHLLPADDRRLHPRYHLKLAITLRGDNNFYTGISSDLSEGGVFIATQHILPIGTPVVLEFHLSRFDTNITLQGVVRWIRTPEATARAGEVFGGSQLDDVKPGMGVQFTQMGTNEARLIREFMRCRTPELFD